MSCTELLVSQRGVPSRAVHWLSHRVVFQVVQCTGCPLEFLGVPWISLRFPGVCIALAIIVITIIIVITFVIDMFAITYYHHYYYYYCGYYIFIIIIIIAITIITTIFWGTLEFPGVPWSSLEFFGVLWSSLEFPGVPWSSLEVPRVPWSSLELLGVRWSSLEFATARYQCLSNGNDTNVRVGPSGAVTVLGSATGFHIKLIQTLKQKNYSTYY